MCDAGTDRATDLTTEAQKYSNTQAVKPVRGTRKVIGGADKALAWLG